MVMPRGIYKMKTITITLATLLADTTSDIEDNDN